jgi:hypothetical protein
MVDDGRAIPWTAFGSEGVCLAESDVVGGIIGCEEEDTFSIAKEDDVIQEQESCRHVEIICDLSPGICLPSHAPFKPHDALPASR